MNDLSVTYPQRGMSPACEALRGISLTLGAGEVVGVLGSAGSGKSTFARVAAGRHLNRDFGAPPAITGGDVLIFGQPLRHATRRQMDKLAADIGYLPQGAADTLQPDRTVSELVAAPILERDRDFPTKTLIGLVAGMVDSVGLSLQLMDKYPYELSGGQRQRVALARALVLKPALLVADEPMAGLDLSVRDTVARLLATLSAEAQMQAIIVTHDLPVLRRAANRVLVLDQGRMIALGSIEATLDDPSHPFLRQLAGALDDGHAITDDID